MTSETELIPILLAVNLGSEASTDKLDLTTRELRTELKERVEAVSFIEVVPPEGARVGEAIALGALSLAVAPVAIREIIKLIHDWCLRAESRTVEIEIRQSKYQTTRIKMTGDIPPEHLQEILTTVRG
jgi:hypothetical protein